jgi:hypothetical protein
MGLRIEKLSDFEFYVAGDVRLTVSYSKSVEVDGEIYHKEWRDFEMVDVGDCFLNNKERLSWCVYEYDWLYQFGIENFKIYYPELSQLRLYGYHYSEDEFVHLGMNTIHEYLLKLLPKCSLRSGRQDSVKDCVSVFLYGYGWNSNVYLEFKPHHFLNLDLRLIKLCDYRDFIYGNNAFKNYPDYKKLTEEDKYQIAVQIFKQKVKKYATN